MWSWPSIEWTLRGSVPSMRSYSIKLRRILATATILISPVFQQRHACLVIIVVVAFVVCCGCYIVAFEKILDSSLRHSALTYCFFFFCAGLTLPTDQLIKETSKQCRCSIAARSRGAGKIGAKQSSSKASGALLVFLPSLFLLSLLLLSI